MTSATMSQARAVLQQYFGYSDFRPAQVPAIEAVLSQRDAVIVLPTGGGKSICFQVPALCRERLTVVVSPLISLMADQVQALERRGVAATFLNSTLAPDESQARIERLRRRAIRLLYVAPERLVTGNTVSLLTQAGVGLLAIDEAHCVSEWGQDFRPSYLRLAAIREALGNPQMIALTATATPRVRRDVSRLLALRDPVIIVGGFDRPNLTFRVRKVANDGVRHQAMVSRLKTERDPAVVYAATRRQVELITRILSSGGVKAVAYHAGLAAERRARAQDAFMRGDVPVIIATNAFGMGIDKPNVRLVLHYLHSGSLEDYYQEAGRAGRDGARSHCLLLFNPSDRQVHDRMRAHGEVRGELVRQVWQILVNLSGGRRPIPLDARFVAGRIGQNVRPDAVANALRVLEERNVVSAVRRPDRVRVRLLASPLRIECERASLTVEARMLLEHLVAASLPADSWQSVSMTDCGLAAFRFDAGLAELESRQLIYADRPPCRALLEGSSRAQLERLIRQLENRREVERAKLNSMVGYASTLMCRRRFILNYFGDKADGRGSCGDCDICVPSS